MPVLLERHCIAVDDRPHLLQLSSDGALLFCAAYGHLALYDTTTGAQRWHRRFDRQLKMPFGLALAPDSSLLACVEPTAIALLDPRDGALVRRLEIGLFTGRSAFVGGPDRLAVGGNCVRVFDLHDGSLVRSFGEQKLAGRALDFDEDHRTLVAVNLKSIGVFDLASGDLRKTHTVARFGVSGVACDARAHSAWTVESGTTLSRWELSRVKRLRTHLVELGGGACAMARDADRSRVAVLCDNGVRLYRFDDGALLAEAPLARGYGDDIASSATGTVLASAHVQRTDDARDGGCVRVFTVE